MPVPRPAGPILTSPRRHPHQTPTPTAGGDPAPHGGSNLMGPSTSGTGSRFPGGDCAWSVPPQITTGSSPAPTSIREPSRLPAQPGWRMEGSSNPKIADILKYRGKCGKWLGAPGFMVSPVFASQDRQKPYVP